MTVCKPEIIRGVEKCINEDKHIIVLDTSNTEVLSLICKEVERRGSSDIEVWNHTELCTQSKQARAVSKREMDDILKFYHLYDFSDRVTVISESAQYGSLFNYVRNGILTKEEMVDAILYG